MEAKDSGEHTMVSTGQQLRLNQITPRNTSEFTTTQDGGNVVNNLLSERPDLKYLPT